MGLANDIISGKLDSWAEKMRAFRSADWRNFRSLFCSDGKLIGTVIMGDGEYYVEFKMVQFEVIREISNG